MENRRENLLKAIYLNGPTMLNNLLKQKQRIKKKLYLLDQVWEVG